MASRKLKSKDQPFQVSGDTKRIVPLGAHTWAYINDHAGKCHHVRRDGDEIVAVVAASDDLMKGKLSEELAQLGWVDVLERLNPSGETEPSHSDSAS
jgi:hypothetical protein